MLENFTVEHDKYGVIDFTVEAVASGVFVAYATDTPDIRAGASTREEAIESWFRACHAKRAAAFQRVRSTEPDEVPDTITAQGWVATRSVQE